MNKNLLLYLTLIGSKLVGGLLCLGLALLLSLFVHWHLNPEHYKSVLVMAKDGNIAFTDGKPISYNPLPNQGNVHHPDKTNSAYLSNKGFYLNELNAFSIYYTFCQTLLSIILSLFMVREVIKVLKSVQDRQTFTINNVKSFRRLGYLCLAMLALNDINYLSTNQDSSLSFSLNFTMVAFMLAAFIMAEIFKEGQYLSEQDQLTI